MVYNFVDLKHTFDLSLAKLISILFSVIFAGCSLFNSNPGYLKIEGIDSIKNVDSSATIEILANKEFQYNKSSNQIKFPTQAINFLSKTLHSIYNPIKLPKGSYLILADCSSKIIEISSGQTTTIKLNKHRFLFPNSPTDLKNANFTIECERTPNSKFRHLIKNRANIYVIEDYNHQVHLSINQNATITLAKKSSETVLSAIKIITDHSIFPSFEAQRIYIQSLDQRSNIHGYFDLETWIYLVPGKYKLFISGSSKIVNLSAGISQQLNLGYLTVKTPSFIKKHHLAQIARLTTHPFQLNLKPNKKPNDRFSISANSINNHHIKHLDADYIYPLFPDEYRLNIANTNHHTDVKILPSKLTSIDINAIVVNGNDYNLDRNENITIATNIKTHKDTSSPSSSTHTKCSPKSQLIIYDHNTSQINSRASMSMVHFFFQKMIDIELSNSHRLKYQINLKNNQNIKLINIGCVKFIPKKLKSKNQSTVLVRVVDNNINDTDKNKIIGTSFDLNLKNSSSLELITGSYNLVAIDIIKAQDGSYEKKLNLLKTFTIKNNLNQNINFIYYDYN